MTANNLVKMAGLYDVSNFKDIERARYDLERFVNARVVRNSASSMIHRLRDS